MPRTKKDSRLSAKAYEWIKEAILSKRLQEGEPLHEQKLAEEIGISRTPIREVLRILEQEGFVKSIPGRGAFVAEVSLNDLREIYEIRVLLEPFAARSALKEVTDEEIQELENGWKSLLEKAEANGFVNWNEVSSIDRKFHGLLISKTQNKKLCQILKTLQSQIERFQFLAATSLSDIHATVNQHMDILSAIRKKDEDGLERLLREHIQKSEEYILSNYLKRKSIAK